MATKSVYFQQISIVAIVVVVFFVNSSLTAFTEEERVALLKFREALGDVEPFVDDDFYKTDSFLMRWLKAKNMDVNAANEMIRAAGVWRFENQIDAIVDKRLYNFTTQPYTYRGFDKEGRPIVLFTPTSIDLRKMLIAGKRNVVIQLWDQMLERGLQILKDIRASAKNGEEVTKFIVILDLAGFNLKQHFCLQCIGVYYEWIFHYENYYPDSIEHFAVINTNRIAIPFVEILKTATSRATQKALKVFGPNRPQWSEFLLSIISTDQLPYRFGGTASN